MRGFLILIVAVLFSIAGFAQQDSGFTNKAEAKNLIVNGLKEGKWIEYMGMALDSNIGMYRYYSIRVIPKDSTPQLIAIPI
jgi:hypothetical protein